MKLLFTCVALLSMVTFASGQQSTSSKISVSLPGESWAIEIDAPGFKVVTNELRSDGRQYMDAQNDKSGIDLSVFLEKSPGGATVDGCQQNQQARLQQKVPYKRTNTAIRNEADAVIAEFTIPEFDGAPVQQRNLFACLTKGDVYIDIHLSKVQFNPKQEELFEAILKTTHVVDKASADSVVASANAEGTLQNFQEGSRYFVQGNYAAAIKPYQDALSAEKQSRTLNHDLWRVLVDNLGMAYGITGDLSHAEETFNYGLSLDPTYPMFYYELACVAAGRNDMDNTMKLLQKAFSYRANIIAGESMPDPRQDDSFKPFMGNQRFREFLDSLSSGN